MVLSEKISKNMASRPTELQLSPGRSEYNQCNAFGHGSAGVTTLGSDRAEHEMHLWD
jgi:hypothetical protein